MSEALRIAPSQSALLVMDHQKWLLANLVSNEQATALLENTSQLIVAARAAKMTVIHVMVAFRDGYPEVNERNRVFSQIKQHGLLAARDADTDIHPAVAPEAGEPVVTKTRVGAFSGTDLERLLRAKQIETLVLAGFTTSGVVLSTTRQAADLDYRLIVAGDCCADHDADVHQILLDKILSAQADVSAARRIVAALSA